MTDLLGLCFVVALDKCDGLSHTAVIYEGAVVGGGGKENLEAFLKLVWS